MKYIVRPIYYVTLYGFPILYTTTILPLTDSDAAYLAGIIDGEGSILLYRQRTGRYYPVIQICNTNPDLIEWLRSKLLPIKVSYSSAIHKRGGKRMYFVNISNFMSIHALLSVIGQFLVVKKENASIVMEFVRARIGKQIYSRARYEQDGILYERLRSLKHVTLRS